MAYPVLATQNTWYKGATDRASITWIIIQNSGSISEASETWTADDAGLITCGILGETLYIIGDGSGKIALNADSASLFAEFTAVTGITGLDLLDASAATTLEKAFYNCQAIVALDLTSWDVSNVKSLKRTFYQNYALTELKVNGWNTSNVESMQRTFNRAKSLTSLNLTGWTTPKVTDMFLMFASDPSTGDMQLTSITGIENWDVSKATTVGSMFQRCANLTSLDLSNWNLLVCTDIWGTFTGCSNLRTLKVPVFDTSNLTEMATARGAFDGDTLLETIEGLENWNTSNVNNMQAMFAGCTSLKTLNISNWNVSNVATMKGMFSCDNDYGEIPMVIESLDISNWDTSSCTNMSFMFYGCKGPGAIDVSKWDVSKVTTFDHIFAHSYLYIGDISGWRTDAATNFNCAFHSVMNETLDVSGFTTDNVTSFGGMFKHCFSTKKIIGLENFNTATSIDFSDMFYNCAQITELDLSNFDTRGAKDGVVDSGNGTTSATLSGMFQEMPKLQKITLGVNFSIDGDGSTTDPTHKLILPTQSSENIPYANGYWYSEDGTKYAPNAIPTLTAATYYAYHPQATKDFFVKGNTLIELSDCIRAVTGISGPLTPAEMITALQSIDTEDIENNYLKAVIENTVNRISNDATGVLPANFQKSNTTLTYVNFPNLTEIDSGCFTDCSNISYLNFPSLKKITNGGNFTGLRALDRLYFPNLETISGWGWNLNGCENVTRAYFPKLGNFTSNDLTNSFRLVTLILGKTDGICTLPAADHFNNTPIAGRIYESGELGYVYVPAALIDTYKADEYWSVFASQIRAIEDYPEVLEGWE